MSFSPPVVFTTGSLSAADLSNNFKAARDYINAEVITGDLETASFDTQDIAAGYPVLVTQDHVFETGNHYVHSVIADDSLDRAYIAGTLKNADLTQQVVYVSVPGAARQVWLDSTSDVVIEATGIAIGSDTDPALAYETKTSPTPVLVNSTFYIEIDGDIEGRSACYVFPEDGGTPSSQSVASGTPDFGTGANARRPLYLWWCAPGLSPGWHTIRVVCDPRFELLYRTALSLQIEVLGGGGYTSYVGSSFITG